jgi:hypothetical protein
VADSVAVVLCQRLDEPGYPVNGSTIERCRCGQEVWVAASTYDRAPIAVRIDFVCSRCVTPEEFAMMREQFDLPTYITPSFMAELVQHRRDHPEEWR